MKNAIQDNASVMSLIAQLAQKDPNRFSSDLVNEIEDGNVYASPHVVYVKKEVTSLGNGTFDMVDSNTKDLVGVANIEGTRLPKKQAFIYDKVAVRYAKEADAGKEGLADYGDKLPASLKNCTLRVSQNGRVHLELPLCDLDTDGTATDPNQVYLNVGPNIIKDDASFKIQILGPEGADVAGSGSDHHYLGVFLQGYATRTK